jgi:exodeoxyribonuclease VII large subunit
MLSILALIQNNHKALTGVPAACMLILMDQMLVFEDRFWTVSTLTNVIRNLLEKNEKLMDCWVRGEISNLSRPASGHIYFTLKDAGAALRCVVWKMESRHIRFAWVEGGEVEAHGRVSVYPVQGQYQLVVDAIKPVGEGYLFQEFIKLKTRLEAEGLFDMERKRPIPERPERIGVVTSATGAAWQDIQNTISRRYPLAEVILCPSPVQGVDAPAGIVRALERVVSEGKPEVIILARGGGSLEDLWAFNDEQVVRAISVCPVPIVTGIGHETDFTLADFSADLRAPTPTAAAELATPDRMELMTDLAGASNWLTDSIETRIDQLLRELTQQQNRLRISSPMFQLRIGRQRLDEQMDRFHRGFAHQAQVRRMQLNGVLARLTAINPESVVKRGYAIVTNMDTRQVIASIHQVSKGDKMNIQVRDGSFTAVAGEMD